MSEYWLCDAGVTLRAQIDAKWPKRSKASDGWIGDASHAAAASDHNPCWSCSGTHYGVVRALDIDASLGGPAGYNTTAEAWKLAQQLRAEMLDGDGRISYIIAYDPGAGYTKICSTNPAYQPVGVWRKYTGASHVNHIHVSFTQAGDHHGRDFACPILKPKPTVPQRLKDRRDALRAKIAELTAELKRVLDRIAGKRAGS